MIIDLILDRKDGRPYEPKKFYDGVMRYGEIGHGIASALDGGEEADVKGALSDYLSSNNYSDSVIDYVNSVTWL